ncbi:MAG: hypothetical protein ACTSSG_04285 [Candidatus Heimdallarchaeaceae archaeon]
MKKKNLLMSLFFFLLMVLLVRSIQAIVIETNNVTLELVIEDAFYTSLDSNNIQDDILSYFSLDIDCKDDKKYVYFSLQIELTLPSGTSYSYLYNLKVFPGNYAATLILYNHATEKGNYLLEITCVLYDYYITSGTERFIFDPPGENEGSDPPFASLTLES